MKNLKWCVISLMLGVSLLPQLAGSQTIEQQLVVVLNEKTTGGHFNVGVQVKGTDLPAQKTLGSATIDVYYDTLKLSYVNGTLWVFGLAEGYNRSALRSSSRDHIRIAVTGGGVGPTAGGLGYDIPSAYTSWVQLNFTILDASGTTNLTIDGLTNQFGLFQNYQNNPDDPDQGGGVINNQTLTAPVNILAQPLPVQLASFIVAPSDNRHVVLSWTTVSEKNNYGFEVQRSLDSVKDYQTIPNSFVKGNGTTLESHTYSYTMANPGLGKWYYRLKQVDLDGTTTYTRGVQGTVKAPAEFSLDQNYPNPFNPTTTISYALPKDARVTLEVYNVIGQRVALLVDEVQVAGYYTVPFDGRAFASGIYFYRLATPEVQFLKKMLVVK